MTKNHERRPYIRVALIIRGGENPEAISHALGMAPDESYCKGAPIRMPPDAGYRVNKIRVYATTIWKLNSRLHHYSYDVEEYVQDILNRVERVGDKIAGLDRRRFNVTMDVSLDLLTDASAVGMGLSVETMARLLRLRAPFDVDTYVWKELPPYASEGLSRFEE